MNNGTAQIFQFLLTANQESENSESFGPFTLPDAEQAYRFDVEPTVPVETIRLDVVDSNGGNTGLVEFALFVTPVTVSTTSSVSNHLPLIFN